jgi:hypothetical protein
MEETVSVIFIGLIVIFILSVMAQSRLTQLEEKIDKQHQISIENSKTLDKIRTQTILLIVELQKDVEELQRIITDKLNSDK